jgi:hypothetical protein
MTDHNLLHRRRYQLNLTKAPVVEITHGPNNLIISIDVGQKFFFRFNAPLTSDVRVGDLLTLYTEVLVQEKPNG